MIKPEQVVERYTFARCGGILVAYFDGTKYCTAKMELDAVIKHYREMHAGAVPAFPEWWLGQQRSR